MLLNGDAEFAGQFPEIRLCLWTNGNTAELANRSGKFFNPGVGRGGHRDILVRFRLALDTVHTRRNPRVVAVC